MGVSLRAIGLMAVLSVLSVALIGAALGSSAARIYDVGAPGDVYVAANFYAPERDAVSGTTFRWSGPAAALLVPDQYAGAAVISARLRGSPAGAPMLFYAGQGAGRLFALTPEPGWRVYHVFAPRQLLWDGSGQPAEIRLNGAISNPAAEDPRALGLALDLLQVKPLAAGPLWPPLRHALLLTWAIALASGGLWLCVRSALASPARLTTARAFLSIPIGLIGGIVFWAWRDSATLGWALPLSPLALGAASALLATLWAGSRLLRSGRPPALYRAGIAVAAGLFGLAHLLLLLPLPVEVRGSAALLILGMPGLLLARLLLADLGDPLERVFIGVCGALALAILLLLALQMLPAAIAPLPLIVLCDLQTALAALALLGRRPRPPAPRPPHPYLALGLILLLGLAFRLPFLGRAELHDDEATAIVAATRMLGGLTDQLLIQLKGPVQVLLPLGPMAILGQINEWLARLPFLIAGMGVILGGYLLAADLLGGRRRWAALAVAAILACDGFLIAFARIVQYQSVVMLMSIGAFWCCWRFYRGVGRDWTNLVAAAIMMAVALLSHYDAIYVAPALAWLVVAGGWSRGWKLGQWVGALALPVAVGAGLLLSFYLPFVLHPHFSETVAHIGERSGQQQGAGWALYNNLAGSYELVIFYNTIPAVWVAVGLLGATLAAAILAHVRPRPPGWLLAGLLVAASVEILRGPGRSLLMERPWLAAAALSLPMAALALSKTVPAALRASLIWFGAAGVAIFFLLEQPRTHMHVMDVPAALLIGQGLAALAQPRRRLLDGLRPWLAVAGAALLLLALPYAYTLFIRQAPEYQRQFPMTSLGVYPALAAEPPAPIGGSGRLGYPAQDGWKVVGELYRGGMLSGPFASNQSTEVSSWYTRGLLRCGAVPEYYMIAMSLTNPAIPPDHHLLGIVQVAGRNRLMIYSRRPVTGEPQIFDLARFRGDFDAQPLPHLPAAGEGCASG